MGLKRIDFKVKWSTMPRFYDDYMGILVAAMVIASIVAVFYYFGGWWGVGVIVAYVLMSVVGVVVTNYFSRSYDEGIAKWNSIPPADQFPPNTPNR